MKVTRQGRNAPVRRSSGARTTPARTDAPTKIADIAAISGIPADELTPRVRDALTSLMAEVASLRAQLDRAKAEVKKLATIADQDPLLGILNRRAFVSELDRTLSLIDRYGEASTLAFVDVNAMKSINDQYGHAGGDAALAHIAKIISENIRRTDVFGRLGGDEFGIIFTRTDRGKAKHKAAKLAEMIAREAVPFGGGSLQVTASFGLARLLPGVSAPDVLKKADAAMYSVKAETRK